MNQRFENDYIPPLQEPEEVLFESKTSFYF
jgi:hypothetical protein